MKWLKLEIEELKIGHEKLSKDRPKDDTLHTGKLKCSAIFTDFFSSKLTSLLMQHLNELFL